MSRATPEHPPAAYFITFTTHGTWLHGDERGSVDPQHNKYLAATTQESPALKARKTMRMTSPWFRLTDESRIVVDSAVRGVCEFKKWRLHALNVRTNHVHVVVTTTTPPETVMNTFKAWATRRLREAGIHLVDGEVWTRHGSTRYLWDHDAIVHASRYVTTGQ